MLVHIESQWHLDPCPEKFKLEWEVWVYMLCPIVRLQWDPGDYIWKDPFLPEKEFTFFQYNAKLRRRILMASRKDSILAEVFWKAQGLDEGFILSF